MKKKDQNKLIGFLERDILFNKEMAEKHKNMEEAKEHQIKDPPSYQEKAELFETLKDLYNTYSEKINGFLKFFIEERKKFNDKFYNERMDELEDLIRFNKKAYDKYSQSLDIINDIPRNEQNQNQTIYFKKMKDFHEEITEKLVDHLAKWQGGSLGIWDLKIEDEE